MSWPDSASIGPRPPVRRSSLPPLRFSRSRPPTASPHRSRRTVWPSVGWQKLAVCAESGWAARDRRRHQGRKAGRVVPVRMLASVAHPVAGSRRRHMALQLGGDHGALTGLRTFEGVEPMGRGRAKAKQVKVARQLKYKSSDGSDLERLRAELAGGADSRNGASEGSEADHDDDEESEDESAEDAWRLAR